MKLGPGLIGLLLLLGALSGYLFVRLARGGGGRGEESGTRAAARMTPPDAGATGREPSDIKEAGRHAG